MLTIPIYVDVLNQIIVGGPYRPAQLNLPPFYWQKKPRFIVYFVVPKSTGFITQGNYDTVDVTPFDMEMLLGKPGVAAIAAQVTWTKDTVNNCFTGQLSCNTAEFEEALEGVDEIASGYFLQINVLQDDDKFPVQVPVRIRKPVHPDEALLPEEIVAPDPLVTNLASIFQDSETVDVQQSGNTFHWDVRRKAGGGIDADADGLFLQFIDAPVPAELLEELTIADATVEEHAFATALTPGAHYRLRYVTGAWKAAAGQGWRMGSYDLEGAELVDEVMPQIGNATQYTTEAEAALANHCAHVDFVADETGTLILHLLDVPGAYEDNVLGSPAPLFQLFQFVNISEACHLDEDQFSYEARTADAAGTLVLTPLEPVHSVKLTISDAYGGGAITVKAVLPVTNAKRGHRVFIRAILPASSDPVLELRNASAAGTVLIAVQSCMVATELWLPCVFNGTAWELDAGWSWKTTTGLPVLNGVARRSLGNISGAVAIDFDDATVLEATLTGNVTFSTTGRAAAGEEKRVNLWLTSSGDDWTIGWASGIKAVGNPIASLEDGRTLLVALSSRGAAETSTRYGGALEEA